MEWPEGGDFGSADRIIAGIYFALRYRNRQMDHEIRLHMCLLAQMLILIFTANFLVP